MSVILNIFMAVLGVLVFIMFIDIIFYTWKEVHIIEYVAELLHYTYLKSRRDIRKKRCKYKYYKLGERVILDHALSGVTFEYFDTTYIKNYNPYSSTEKELLKDEIPMTVVGINDNDNDDFSIKCEFVIPWMGPRTKYFSIEQLRPAPVGSWKERLEGTL